MFGHAAERPFTPAPYDAHAMQAPADEPLRSRPRQSIAASAAEFDAGCSLRNVQGFARHADPRQARRYDRARAALDRDPTYIVATHLAGATGVR